MLQLLSKKARCNFLFKTRTLKLFSEELNMLLVSRNFLTILYLFRKHFCCFQKKCVAFCSKRFIYKILSLEYNFLKCTLDLFRSWTCIVAQDITFWIPPGDNLTHGYVPEKDVVDLFWITESENNNDYFDVERSIDGIDFKKIGTVKGAGNTDHQTQYFTMDEDPFTGVNYYRLKQVDFNGEFEYSESKTHL